MEHRDLNDMAVFAAIAQTGSITAAAKRMHLPKSNVSRRLAKLEERLGTRLLERNTRVSKLTAIGASYANYCRLMVEEADAADFVIDKSVAEPTGQLHVSSSVLVGQQILAPVVASYVQKFPKVQVILNLDNSRVNLIEDGFDIAFRIGENKDSSLISQSIALLPLRLFASPDYLNSINDLKEPSDLKNCRCILMSNHAASGKWLLEKEKERVEVSISAGTIANDFLALRNLAVAGGGITILPAYAAHTEVQSGRLVQVLPDWSGQKAELSAVYPSRRGATIKHRAFIEHVKSWISQHIEQ